MTIIKTYDRKEAGLQPFGYRRWMKFILLVYVRTSKDTQFSLTIRLLGAQSLSGTCAEEKSFLSLKRIQHDISGDPVFVGPCHHGNARPQVADGGTASDMEGSCE